MTRSRREIQQSIFYYLCLAFVFLLPVYGKLIPTVIALMVLNLLIDGGYIRNFRKLFRERQRIMIFLFTFLYFLYMIGMLYSKNMSYGLFDLEVKLSLFVFPFLFATTDDPAFSEEKVDRLLWTYIAGCFTGVLVLLAHAIINFFFNRVPTAFYYRDLSWSFHPSYIAMYLVFGIAVLGYFLLSGKDTLTKLSNAICLSLILIFFIFIVLLSSKAGIVSLAVVVFLITVYIFFKQRKPILGLMILLMVSSFFYVALKNLPLAAHRFSKAGAVVNNNNDSILLSSDGTAERLFVWKATLQVIRQYPLTGVGTGDVKDVLYDRYKAWGNSIAFKQKLNPHNQYLETFAALGIMGFLCLVAILLIPALWSLRKGYWLYFVFIVIFGMNIFVESMLETQAGVVFYAFFNIVLFRARK